MPFSLKKASSQVFKAVFLFPITFATFSHIYLLACTHPAIDRKASVTTMNRKAISSFYVADKVKDVVELYSCNGVAETSLFCTLT